MAVPPSHLPVVGAKNRAEWRAWLAANHDTQGGVVLVYFKLGSGKPSVTYPDAVREALCFGWIDTTRYALDAERYQQVFVPRRVGSVWSRLNKTYIAELESAGLMTSAGRAKIEAAQQDGSWSRLDAGESLEVPPDLQTALLANAEAAQHFAGFPASIRKYILHWIAEAKRPETRQQRIAQTVEQAAQNIRARGERRVR
ncbi:YdeI/OmpD-associated family protein (plasmid) [Deinococcus sp. KNUC1210]|uniref:YdeI/OmpD-associated family protein n=1 Tax=Deinococcus sp. KNUC1210 TaxID=2917691 RepID=UPI001EF013AD|nr:YdeI/OmpD-associated family protein [Deinococcus sp. KNUC1210]ULH14261.1 YdeI/OmpD-associated family protein [Deinococcus sp. KNUC1210]